MICIFSGRNHKRHQINMYIYLNAHAHSIQIMTLQRYNIEIKILLEMTRIFRIFSSFFSPLKLSSIRPSSTNALEKKKKNSNSNICKN